MGTIADLKRKLIKGQGIKLVDFKDNLNSNNSRLNVVRYVVKTQGNGVYLSVNKEDTKGSFLEFPKASLFEMDNKGFKTFCPAERDLTEEEQKIRDNEPRDEKQEEIDALSDGSCMFWRIKAYYKEQNAEYLFSGNSKAIQGKYLIIGRKGEKDKIRDDSLKGEMSLSYEFVD